jgi:hypothetical protein
MWLPLAGDTGYAPLATHPRVAFSRHIRVEQPDSEPPDADFFNLLIAFANPTGLEGDQQIDVSREVASLLDQFERGPNDQRLKVAILAGRTGLAEAIRARVLRRGWTLVGDGQPGPPRPATLRNISSELQNRCHGLHVVAHGEFSPADNRGVLQLENDDGGRTLVDHTDLESWITADLQLIVLQSCQSGATVAEGSSPFTSLAPRLIRLGLPSAVAMQDYIGMADAREFFAVFYRRLLDKGQVDLAVNNGRQVLRSDRQRDDWSIPALFSHLRSGSLWRPDPLRASLVGAFGRLPDAEMTPWPEMLQAIEHTRGVSGYDPVEGAAGPRFNLWERLVTCATQPRGVTILTGPRGAYKSGQLRRLFRDLGTAYRNATGDGPLPVLVTLSELAGGDSQTWPIFYRIWSRQTDNLDDQIKRLAERRVVFLVDAEQELQGPARQQALQAIARLRSALPESSVIIAIDEPVLPTLVDVFDKMTLLVSQSLDKSQIVSYLKSLKGPAIDRLADNIRQRGFSDLAGQPRFLQHMLDLAADGRALPSKRAVLDLIADIYLRRVTTRDMPRACVEHALERIAWDIQNGRGVTLEAPQVSARLAGVRGDREFGLGVLTHALVDECRLLLPSGDEGLRFAYGVMQSYFAARYLATAPDRERLIEDITASLGRLARLRRWERVLILLGSMLPWPGDLLGAILAGSSLMDGEQLFVAVRCYQEAVADRTAQQPPTTPGGPRVSGSADESLSDLTSVAKQLVDALIWRSSWDPTRPYADRRKALDRLVDLAAVLVTQEHGTEDIIAHLIALACDPVEKETRRYDWGGIRQGAASGLLALYQQANEYVTRHRTDLVELLGAWWALADDSARLRGILCNNDPGRSVIAAFALAQSPRDADRAFLLDAYENIRDDNDANDVHWGIVNAVSTLDATWVQEHVIARWMAMDRERRTEWRTIHTCFLIQKMTRAGDQARQYLADALLHGSLRVQARALRAYSKLQDPAVDEWLRESCEAIVAGALEKVDTARIGITAAALDNIDFQCAALEALRDVGTAMSIETVRQARAGRLRDRQVRQLSFQVAEEMYWRLTRGLDVESFGAGAGHRKER